MSYREELFKQKLYGKAYEKKKVYYIPKKSAKKIAAEAVEKEARGDSDTELQRFFKSAMKRMTGKCIETGEPTETKNYRYAINSICHILPRSHCPSVQTHPCIWIELQQDFHKKFDAMSWGEREKLKCWPVIMEKLIMVWEDLAENEKRHFPESVLQFINQSDPF